MGHYKDRIAKFYIGVLMEVSKLCRRFIKTDKSYNERHL